MTALAYTVGSVFFGVSSERLARAGVSKLTVFKLGLAVSLAMFALLAAGVQTGLGVILAVYGFCTISAALAYSLLTPLFPPAMTGRVNTASNVLMFGCSFAFQWGVGAVLRLYPERRRALRAGGLRDGADHPRRPAGGGAGLAPPVAAEAGDSA